MNTLYPKLLALLQCAVITTLAHSKCVNEVSRAFSRSGNQGHIIVSGASENSLAFSVFQGNSLLGIHHYPEIPSEAGTLARLADPIARFRAMGLIFYGQGRTPRPPVPELLSDTKGNNFLLSYSISPFRVRTFIRANEHPIHEAELSYSLRSMIRIYPSLGEALLSNVKGLGYQKIIDIGKFRIASEGLSREILLVLSYLSDLAAENPESLFIGYAVDKESLSLYQRVIYGPTSQWTQIPDVESGFVYNFFSIKGSDFLKNIATPIR